MNQPIYRDPIPYWADLTDGTKETVRWFVELLAQGFTGKVEMDCVDGGIAEPRITQSLKRMKKTLDGRNGTR